MSGELALHDVSLAELRSGGIYEQWKDPHGLARMPDSKRQAFLSNPLAGADSEPASIVATVDGEVAGRIDLLAGEIVARGERVPVFWGSALYVAPEHRRGGAGLMLMLRMQGQKRGAAVCGISEAVSPIYDKLRWTRFKVPRYVFLIRSGPLVERFLRGRPGRGIARRLGDTALLMPRGAASMYSRLKMFGISVREVPAMPAELGSLFEQTRVTAAPHRSPAWINWLLESRFELDPRTKRSLCLIEDRGEVVGYFLVKIRYIEAGERYAFGHFHLGSLQDWLVVPTARLGPADVALLALERGAALGAEVFAVYLAERSEVGILRGLGFVPFPPLDFLFRPLAGTPLAAPELQRRESWRIRPADGDNFFA